jgi:hypothetical protein
MVVSYDVTVVDTSKRRENHEAGRRMGGSHGLQPMRSLRYFGPNKSPTSVQWLSEQAAMRLNRGDGVPVTRTFREERGNETGRSD